MVRQIWTTYRLQPSQSSDLRHAGTLLRGRPAAEGQMRKTWTVAAFLRTVARSRTQYLEQFSHGAARNRRHAARSSSACRVTHHRPRRTSYSLTHGHVPATTWWRWLQLRPCQHAVGAITFSLFLGPACLPSHGVYMAGRLSSNHSLAIKRRKEAPTPFLVHYVVTGISLVHPAIILSGSHNWGRCRLFGHVIN
jgi:hypothetical protein